MITKDFLETLEKHREKQLVFEYAKNRFVPKAYHITEVKNVYFESVDCGGKEHSDRQTIVQLWTNPLEIKNKYMEAGKALDILKKVDGIKPMHKSTNIFFEYGNNERPTSNYSISKVVIENDTMVLKMYVEPTACKPLSLENLKKTALACCGKNSSCC